MHELEQFSAEDLDFAASVSEEIIAHNKVALDDIREKLENSFEEEDDFFNVLDDHDFAVLEEESNRIQGQNKQLLDKIEAYTGSGSDQSSGESSGEVKKATEEDKTFFVNVFDFVISYLAKVYAENTTQTSKRVWLNDWWKYPAVVSRLNALWISWEKSYKGNVLDTWFLNVAEHMMRYLCDKETGVMTHYISDDASNLVRVRKGEYLPTEDPPMTWYQSIADELKSVGREEIERVENEKTAQTEQELTYG
jgi:hypothetical protein